MRFELVEASCEQSLDRWRHRYVAVARITNEGHHLLDEGRVALGSLLDAGAQAIVELRQAPDQELRLPGRKRLEQHRGRVDLAAAPSCSTVEQIRPGHAKQQDGSVAGEVGDVLDQVKEGP